MKSEIDTFLHYATAFETAYATDNWDEVRNCFAEDAVYEVEGGPPFGGKWMGREAVVAHLIESVNGFDRTFDERALGVVEGPEMRDGAVYVRWSGVYRRKGKADVPSNGSEYAWIQDGKIQRLKDTM
jgi:ketosteroid isomerase-like protein